MIDISYLAHCGPCKKFAAGEHIPCPGGSGDSNREMYILLDGRVDVFKESAAGGKQTAGSLLPGDVFGGREFFTQNEDYVYVAGVDSIAYIISEDSFNELSWTRPDILFEVLRAAYIPMRKMTASQKTAIVTAMNTSIAKQIVPERPLEKTVKESVAKPKATFQAKDETASGDNLTPFNMSMEGGIFPEGHKSYPGITKPEYAHLVFQKDYECPLCKKTFNDYKIFRSKLYETSPIRYDLRRFYSDFQTEWFDVITCHNCLFSAFQNYFTEPKPIHKVKFESELAETRSLVYLDFNAERDIDFVFTSHYLAIICAAGYLSLGRQIRAKLWGNLSWLYEDVKDEEMARFAAAKAAEAYEAVYTETHLTPVQEQMTCLSIAGMQFRAGVDRNLKKFLFAAKTAKMGDKTYAKVAEDFMYELREDDKINES